jgi:antitoxin component of MazEF toxin-antitoxin module
MRYQRVLKHGCSLAIVIPAQVCRELNIRRADIVTLQVLSTEGVDEKIQRFYLEIMPVIHR